MFLQLILLRLQSIATITTVAKNIISLYYDSHTIDIRLYSSTNFYCYDNIFILFMPVLDYIGYT